MVKTKETAWVRVGKRTKAKTVEVEWSGIETCLGIWDDPERIAYWQKDLADVYWIPVGEE